MKGVYAVKVIPKTNVKYKGKRYDAKKEMKVDKATYEANKQLFELVGQEDINPGEGDGEGNGEEGDPGED